MRTGSRQRLQLAERASSLAHVAAQLSLSPKAAALADCPEARVPVCITRGPGDEELLARGSGKWRRLYGVLRPGTRKAQVR
jgi:hypothetical protein